MGVEGAPPLLPPDAEMVWLASGPDRGAVLIGLKERRENDAERILHLACDQPGSSRKAVIKEITVELDGDRPSLDWAGSFASELNVIEEGHTLVDPALAKVYDRLFVFERVEEETEAVQDALGPQARLCGFYSYGEICPQGTMGVCELHNQTMTVTTLSET